MTAFDWERQEALDAWAAEGYPELEKPDPSEYMDPPEPDEEEDEE